jgi:hypothetical protein
MNTPTAPAIRVALDLARLTDAARADVSEVAPNWTPLRRLLPRLWWAGFMWMGWLSVGGHRVERYKHGITRRYLLIDAAGRCYQSAPSLNSKRDASTSATASRPCPATDHCLVI